MLRMKTYYASFLSPIGLIQLRGCADVLTGVFMAGQRHLPPLSVDSVEDYAPFREAWSQIEEYFAGERRDFSLALKDRHTVLYARLARIAITPVRCNGELRGNRSTHRQSSRSSSRGLGKRAQPHFDHRPLSPSHRCKWQFDGLRRWLGPKALSSGFGSERIFGLSTR